MKVLRDWVKEKCRGCRFWDRLNPEEWECAMPAETPACKDWRPRSIEADLKRRGFDGLYCENECGCELGNLAPCDEGPTDRCKPGHKHFQHGEGRGEQDWRICPGPVDVRAITEAYLKEHHLDGLFSVEGECACEMGRLVPCGEDCMDCRPGYKRPMTEKDCAAVGCVLCVGEGHWTIGPEESDGEGIA